MFINYYNFKEKNHFFSIILISFFPALVFLGTGVINLLIIILDLLFLFEIIKKNELKYLNNKFFYCLILLFFVWLTNLLFSINFENSLSRSFGFIRFIFFVFALRYYIFDVNKDYKKHIFKIWLIIFLVINLDLFFEFIFGYNVLGFKSYMPGRLSGFFNQELKIGYLYSSICLVILSYFVLDIKKINLFNIFNNKKNLIYLLAFIILFISLIIGERSNFVKTLIMLILFLFFFQKKNYFKNITLILSTLLILVIIIAVIPSENQYKYRYWIMFLKPLSENPIKFIKNTNYGDHYNAAYKVFKKHKMFGVGLKNYRIVVSSGNYGNNPSIHPHEKHLEILSETGLLGYIFFICFFIYTIFLGIKIYFKNKNLYQLAGMLFIIANLIPVIPSGSFFTTYTATFFWLNFAFMINTSKE